MDPTKPKKNETRIIRLREFKKYLKDILDVYENNLEHYKRYRIVDSKVLYFREETKNDSTLKEIIDYITDCSSRAKVELEEANYKLERLEKDIPISDDTEEQYKPEKVFEKLKNILDTDKYYYCNRMYDVVLENMRYVINRDLNSEEEKKLEEMAKEACMNIKESGDNREIEVLDLVSKIIKTPIPDSIIKSVTEPIEFIDNKDKNEYSSIPEEKEFYEHMNLNGEKIERERRRIGERRKLLEELYKRCNQESN